MKLLATWFKTESHDSKEDEIRRESKARLKKAFSEFEDSLVRRQFLANAFDEVILGEPNGGAWRSIAGVEGCKARVVDMMHGKVRAFEMRHKTGTAFPRHLHTYATETLTCVEGVIVVQRFEEATLILRPGDSLEIPPGLVHWGIGYSGAEDKDYAMVLCEFDPPLPLTKKR